MNDHIQIIIVMFLWAICYPLIVLGLSEAPEMYAKRLLTIYGCLETHNALLFVAWSASLPFTAMGQLWHSLVGETPIAQYALMMKRAHDEFFSADLGKALA